MTKSEHEAQPNHPDDALFLGSRFVKITVTFQQIMRDYLRYLSPTQLAVLLFIMDRTVGWNKRWEIITQKHFLCGISSKVEKDPDYAGSLQISLNTLKKALRELLAIGLILERKGLGRNKNLTAYALNKKHFVKLPRGEQDEEMRKIW